MARKRPPNYGVEQEAVYIPPDDDAWTVDVGKIKANHPVSRYYEGATRYRLAEVEEHLDRSKDPEEYVLGELDVRTRHRVNAMVFSGDSQTRSDGLLLACQRGLAEIRPEKLSETLEAEWRNGALTERALDALDRYDPSIVQAVGLAAVLANLPLRPDEGKQ